MYNRFSSSTCDNYIYGINNLYELIIHLVRTKYTLHDRDIFSVPTPIQFSYTPDFSNGGKLDVAGVYLSVTCYSDFKCPFLLGRSNNFKHCLQNLCM